MSKGHKRSNREVRKPKQNVVKPVVTLATTVKAIAPPGFRA